MFVEKSNSTGNGIEPEIAIEEWLEKGDAPENEGLLVLRDVKLPGFHPPVPPATHGKPFRERMDLVLVKENSVCNPDSALLEVDTVFEIKTNYARQKSEIKARLQDEADSGRSAIRQARNYREQLRKSGSCAAQAYVLYLITSLDGMELPPFGSHDPHSPGLVNRSDPLEDGRSELEKILQPLGKHSGGANRKHPKERIYCALIAIEKPDETK